MNALASIPQAPGALPMLGHASKIAVNPLKFLSSLPVNGEVVRIKLGPMDVVVPCRPGVAQQALIHDSVFDKGGFFFDEVRRIAGNGLSTCPYAEHRRQRRLVQPTFHPARMPDYAQMMSRKIDCGVTAWRDGQTLEVVRETMTMAGNVLSATMFSDLLSDSARKAIQEAGEVFAKGAFRQMILRPPLDRLPFPGRSRYRQTISAFRQVISGVVEDRRQHEVDRGDLLSALLHTVYDSGDRLSNAEVLDQVSIFIIAGQETVARTLAWALHLVAERPDLQARLQSEVDTVLEGGLARYEDLNKLSLTRNIITETLRLWPVVWILTRRTERDVELGGHTIPQGTNVAISPYLIGRDAGLYDDPLAFDPDRWAPERGLVIPRGFFIPFGWGPRKCIGDTFAMNEAILMLATIAARWRLSPVSGQRVRPARTFVLSPENLRLRVSARSTPTHSTRVP